MNVSQNQEPQNVYEKCFYIMFIGNIIVSWASNFGSTDHVGPKSPCLKRISFILGPESFLLCNTARNHLPSKVTKQFAISYDFKIEAWIWDHKWKSFFSSLPMIKSLIENHGKSLKRPLCYHPTTQQASTGVACDVQGGLFQTFPTWTNFLPWEKHDQISNAFFHDLSGLSVLAQTSHHHPLPRLFTVIASHNIRVSEKFVSRFEPQNFENTKTALLT